MYTKTFIKRVIDENAVDTKKYHYWCYYQSTDETITVYRCPQERYFYGVAHGDVEIVCIIPW